MARRVFLKTRARKRAERDRLYAEARGLCYFCGTATVVVDQHLRQPPGNLATIFHLVDRLDPRRQRQPQERRWVLACRDCAVHESSERQFSQPIEELWRRSGRYPQNAMKLMLDKLVAHFNPTPNEGRKDG